MNPIINQLTVSIPDTALPVRPAKPTKPKRPPLTTIHEPQQNKTHAVVQCTTPTFVNDNRFLQVFTFSKLIDQRHAVASASQQGKATEYFTSNLVASNATIEECRKQDKLTDLYHKCLFYTDANADRDLKNKTLLQRYLYLKQCVELFANFNLNNHGNVFLKDGSAVNLSANDLLKIFTWALTKIFNNCVTSAGTMENSTITSILNGKIHIIQILKEVGKGGLAKVYKVIEFSTGKFLALKLCNTFSEITDKIQRQARYLRGVSDLQNEVQILNYIKNKLGNEQKWFTHAPLMMVAPNGKVGYLGALYKDDFWALCTDPKKAISPELAFTFIQQIVEGAWLLSQIGIWHGDYKIQNIFLDDNDGQLRARIGDLGGARYFADVTAPDFIRPTCTAACVNVIDEKRLQVAMETAKKEKSAEAIKSVTAIARQQEVFALGLACYAILTRVFPYGQLVANGHTHIGFSNFGEGFKRKPLNDAGHGDNEPLIKLLAGMLDHDATKRTSFDVAAKEMAQMKYIPPKPKAQTAAATPDVVMG